MRRLAVLALLALAGCADSGGHTAPPPWNPDLGDGRYANPVLFADYSDPDVVRVGDDFYLTASSFDAVPGLPILHSRDLVSWTIVGHALPRLPSPHFDEVRPGEGVWAPCLRYHGGWYWIFFADPDVGIYMTKARDPAGPWEPTHLVQAAVGWIDPSPLWDDDGQAYLVHAFAWSRAHVAHQLTVHRMSPDGTQLLDEGQIAYDGHHWVAPYVEGPKFYKRGGYYYILAPAGGVPDGWQLAMRSTTPLGPYQAQRVLERGSTSINGPHQGGWVELASGESWFLHFQDRGPYGRVVHLEPLSWVDDWPRIGIDLDGNGVGEPVSEYGKPEVSGADRVAAPQTSDEFEDRNLGLQWQWPANPRDEWTSLSARPGWLRIQAMPPPVGSKNLWTVPNLALQKFPASAFSVTTELDVSRLAVGDRMGLVIMGKAYSYLAVERGASGLRVVRVTCPNASAGGGEVLDGETVMAETEVRLRVEVDASARTTFSHAEHGSGFVTLGEPFDAIPGQWIGAKVGLFALASAPDPSAGFADAAWFRFE